MSEAPKRVWVGYSITGAPCWSVNPHEARGHDKAMMFISAAALWELCEKWRKKQKFFYSCEDSKEVRHGTGIREVCDELEKLLEGK